MVIKMYHVTRSVQEGQPQAWLMQWFCDIRGARLYTTHNYLLRREAFITGWLILKENNPRCGTGN